MRAPLYDTHCHLDFPALASELEAVLARAREAGVERIVTVGAGRQLDSAPAALRIARDHPEMIRATAGLHPHDARLLDRGVERRLAALAADPLVVAIGETGLDFHYDNSPRDRQEQAFRWQVGLAREVGKPVVIHTRDADEPTLRVLREERVQEVGGILHCFSGDLPFARAGLELGLVVSFSGIVTFPRAAAVQETARALPLEAILVETDAPFLAPVPHRGRQNEPAYVGATAAAVARLREMDEAELRRATFANAVRVLGPAAERRS
jgi:TatD DNase family protein